MAQAAREKALTRFREGKLQVLVATDVAARGIDVAGVTHVINYTCPEDEKTYVHRIGRTGRAGAPGIAITFVDWADLHRWKMINKALDLPFDDPPETYSTSEHFLHDQGIPPGTKGRIVPEKPREPASPGSSVATEVAAVGATAGTGTVASVATARSAIETARVAAAARASLLRALPLPRRTSRRTKVSRAPGTAAAVVVRAPALVADRRLRQPDPTKTAQPPPGRSSSRQGPVSPGTR